MASSNLRRSNAIGHIEKLIELDEIVAKRAGNRRPPGQILGDKGLNHLPLELLLEIHHVIGNAELLGHPPCIVNIVQRAAPAASAIGRKLREAALIPEL